MLREALNKVYIEGILSEVGLDYASYVNKTTGAPVNCIRGVLKVRVDQEIIKGEGITRLEIPVQYFANEFKKNGEPNPIYKSLEEVMKSYKSIAAVGEDDADRIRISSARINMNEYWKDPENLISYPRISATFVNRINGKEITPAATFEANFMVVKNIPEVDFEGVETGRQIITAAMPTFEGRNVLVVPFIAATPNVVDVVSTAWEVGSTVHARGKLNFSTTTETVVTEEDFGDPIERTKTKSVSDIIITSGQRDPLSGDEAYDPEEMKTALLDRQQKLDERKQNDLNKNKPKNHAAPAQGFGGLGF